MPLKVYPLRFLSTLFVFSISFLLFVPHSEASQGNSPGGLPYSKVGIVNNTPNYQLELTIDGTGPCVIGSGQTGNFFLKDEGLIGDHQLVAKAYVLTKYFGRLQIGKERTIIFQVTGEVKDLPTGKVGWHKIFTYKDFFQNLSSFPTKRHTRIRPTDSRLLCAQRPIIKYIERSKKDDILGLIRGVSQRYRLPITLLTAVIEVESAFNTYAVSRDGALGLMQLMPQTCARFSVHRPFDPQQNVEGGAKYLSYLLHQWSLRYPSYRRLELSLAAYNAGESTVELYGEIPPFKETKNYVRKVLRRYNPSPTLVDQF
jgi:hypothetical protein